MRAAGRGSRWRSDPLNSAVVWLPDSPASTGEPYLQRVSKDCNTVNYWLVSPHLVKKRLKSSQFNPQGYEFPVLMSTFANGSGRIDINLFLYLFCPSVNTPGCDSVY
jgi:hypothetical protein